MQVHLKHHRPAHRVYRTIAENPINQHSITHYLQQNQFQNTLKIFQQEQASKAAKYQINSECSKIMKIFSKGSVEIKDNFQLLIVLIKKNMAQSSNNEDFIEVEFYLYILCCLNGTQLEQNAVTRLKAYIDRNGQILTNIPSLLPYFALPYSEKPSEHKVLQKIFTKPWVAEIRQRLEKLISPRNSTEVSNEEIEWFRIVKDMIQICNSMRSKASMKEQIRMDCSLKQMVERVASYEQVIAQHEVVNQNLSPVNKRYSLHQNNLDQSTSLIQILQQNKAFSQQERQQKLDCFIFHELSLQIQRQDNKFSKRIIKQCIESDILSKYSAAPDDPHKNDEIGVEILKFIRILASYFVGRQYLSTKYSKLIWNCCEAIFSKNCLVQLPSQLYSLYELERIQCLLDILQKLCIRPEILHLILNQQQIIDSIAFIIQNYQQFHLVKEQEEVEEVEQMREQVLALSLALTMNMVLHRSGREKIKETNILEMLIGMISLMDEHMANQVESLAYSIVYLMLIDRDVVARAEKLNFKEILLDNMITHNTQYQTKIVQHLIERMDAQESQQGLESDEDEETSDEYDQTIIIEQAYCWVHHQKITYSKKFIYNAHFAPQPKIQEQSNKVKPNLPKTHLNEINESKSEYVMGKYNWKPLIEGNNQIKRY